MNNDSFLALLGGLYGGKETYDSTLHRIYNICKQHYCGDRNPGFIDLCKQFFQDYMDQLEHMENSSEATDISATPKVILIVLYSIITVLSVVGNSLVILTFVSNRHMRSVTNAFIVALAGSDLLITLTCIPINMGSVITRYWVFGSFACKMVPYLMTFVLSSSSLTLCCIAIHRYYAIVHPLRLGILQTPGNALILLLVVWVVSALASIPNTIYYVEVAQTDGVCHDTPRYLCYWPDPAMPRQTFSVWMTDIFLFLIPLIVMSGAYGMICFKLWIKRPVGATTMTVSNTLKMKKKAIKMLIIVVLIFVVCWLPLFAYNATSEILDFQYTETYGTSKAYLQCLALSSCCYNPFVYAFMHEKFRKNFANVLRCRARGQVRPIVQRFNIQPISGSVIVDCRVTTHASTL